MWRRTLVKKAALVLVACAVALTWSRSGVTQGACEVERGIDPLDILTQNAKHNVWIALDTSGSMNGGMPGSVTKIDAARNVIVRLLDELVDDEGNPLVNWGFTHFDSQFQRFRGNPIPTYPPKVEPWPDPSTLPAGIEAGKCNVSPDANGDGLPDLPSNCHGMDDFKVDPPGCLGEDTRPIIRDRLNLMLNIDSNGDGIGDKIEDFATGTPNGVLLDEVSTFISTTAPFRLGELLDNQRNFIILLSDGNDTCECYDIMWDDPLTAENERDIDPKTDTQLRLRGSSATSALSNRLLAWDPTGAWTVDGNANQTSVAAYNAGLKGRQAYRRMNTLTGNPDDPLVEEGAGGDIYVVGMGLSTGERVKSNHLAWESSGVADLRQGRPAFFANSQDELLRELRKVFALIGIPNVEATLGTSVVGSVKELIPEIPGVNVSADDVHPTSYLSDPTAVSDARRLRTTLRNNVLLTTSVELPGFKGHLRAYNVFQVQDFESGNGTRTPDLATSFFQGEDSDRNCNEPGCFWDAGIALRNRSPGERTILFNYKDDAPGTAPTELRLLGDGLGTLDPTALGTLLGVDVGYLKGVDGTGALSKEDAAKMVVAVMRGYRLSVHPTTGTLYKPAGDPEVPGYGLLNISELEADGVTNTWKLYDSTGVGPAIVQDPPRSPDQDPPAQHEFEYGSGNFPDGYYWQHFNRQTVVYLPTNAGMMHAFRGDNGAELFAYIPPDALGDWATGETAASRSTIKDFVEVIVKQENLIAGHLFFLASSPTVEDVYIWDGADSPDDWHTAIVFGRGKGGKFLTALDVTNIPSYPADLSDPALVASVELLFNVGNRQGIVDSDVGGGAFDYDGLGETWSIPVIGNVKTTTASGDQWVVFAGAGYGCTGTLEGQYLYVLSIEDGSIVQRFEIGNDAGAPIQNGLVATPALYNPHQWDFTSDNDYTVRAYIGDLQGKVWSLNCADADPAAWTFTQLFDVGNTQPITVQAALFEDQTDVWVFVGTGGDNRVDDTFQLVALKDAGTGPIDEPAYPPIQLEEGHRVVIPPVIGGEFPVKPGDAPPTIFFASTRSVFDIDLCRLKFSSNLHAIDVFTGLGTFDINPYDEGTQESMSVEGKVTGLYLREDALYVSKSGGLDVGGGTLVLGSGEPMNLDDVTGGATGTVQILVRGFRMSPF